MNSVSVSKPSPHKWQLKKTLSRKPHFRPIEDADMRFIYASYRSGNLASMGGVFEQTDMQAVEFKQAFEQEVLNNYHGAWTLFAPTSKGVMQVGLILGFWSHPNPQKAPFMTVGDMVWFPWASDRNKIESVVNFFNTIRNDFQMMEYAKQEDKRFFEVMMMHAIMRRVGKSYNVYEDQEVTLFETRKPS